MLTSHTKSVCAPNMAAKFWGSYKVIQYIRGNKFRLRHQDTGLVREEHSDFLELFPGDKPEAVVMDDYIMRG